jgi:hypothetical protein
MASRYSFLQGLQQYRARCTSFNPAVNALFKQARARLRAPQWGTHYVQLRVCTPVVPTRLSRSQKAPAQQGSACARSESARPSARRATRPELSLP